MTVKVLMQKYKANNPEGHFFDKETIKYFNDRDREVEKDPCMVKTHMGGEIHKCWVYHSTISPEPEAPGYKTTHYFDTETFAEVVGDPFDAD